MKFFKSPFFVFFSGLIFLFMASLSGIFLGSSDYGFSDFLRIIFSMSADETAKAVIIDLRLPRVMIAGLAGAILSCGGLVFQALFRNPLSEPYILGLSGGAGAGALLAITAGFSRFPSGIFFAFSGVLAALFTLFYITSWAKFRHSDSLILSGVMINSFCGAMIMFMLSVARDAKVYGIISWLMGDLSNHDFTHVAIIAAFFFPCFFLVWLFSHYLNLIAAGEELAITMGVNAASIMYMMIILVSVQVAVLVSFCGLIGFIGLVVPHIARRLAGYDHRILVPACAVFGAGFMILCDLLSRMVYPDSELPVGVVTALIGSPFFITLLKRGK